MDYPAGYFSDECDDEYDGFLSDESNHSDNAQNWSGEVQVHEATQEEKIGNLYYSIIHGNLLSVTNLLDSGLSVDSELQDSWKPIVLAASFGNIEIIHELITRGANINDHRNCRTVLMEVCNCPQTTTSFETSFAIVEELLQHGVNANAVTRKRETALMFAAGRGNVAVIRLLLPHCNIAAEDNKGWSALFWAVYNNNVEATQILLDAGLESNKTDVCGNKPLYYATMQENEDIMKILAPPEEETWNESLKTGYDFVQLFKDSAIRPQFLQDIYSMLYGMKCGYLQKLFSSVTLLDFLSIDDQSLMNMGVQLPFQRNRVLTGLYKFHKHLFKQKSIPVIAKKDLYSTVDVSCSLLTAIRQLTVMEASLEYIKKNDRDFTLQENNDIIASIKVIRDRIARLKRSSAALDNLAEQWDNSNNKKVDIITYTCCIFQFTFKTLIASSISVAAGIFLIRKFCVKS